MQEKALQSKLQKHDATVDELNPASPSKYYTTIVPRIFVTWAHAGFIQSHTILQEFRVSWYIRSCRIYIINSMVLHSPRLLLNGPNMEVHASLQVAQQKVASVLVAYILQP